MSTYSGKKDLELWRTWNSSRTPDSLGNLLKATEGARYRGMQPWQGTISPVSLNSEALKQSVKAFETFKPEKGNKLTTHLTNYLQKASRLVYEEASMLRVPESRQMKAISFRNAQESLEEELGREPSAEEMSDELGWPVREIQRFKQESRQVLISSEPLPVGVEGFCPEQGTNATDKMHYVIADMDPVDQTIFRHTTGYGNSSILSGKDLTKKLNINQGQLSYRKKQIAKNIRRTLPGTNVSMLDCS